MKRKMFYVIPMTHSHHILCEQLLHDGSALSDASEFEESDTILISPEDEGLSSEDDSEYDFEP